MRVYELWAVERKLHDGSYYIDYQTLRYTREASRIAFARERQDWSEFNDIRPDDTAQYWEWDDFRRVIWRRCAKEGDRVTRVRMHGISKFTKGRAYDFEDPSAEEGR